MSLTITSPSAPTDDELRLDDGDIARGIALISDLDCVLRDKSKEMPAHQAAANVLSSYGRREDLNRWLRSIGAVTPQDQQAALACCLTEHFGQK